MKKINQVLENSVVVTENRSNISSFSSTSTGIPNKLIAIAQRNPFREPNDSQERLEDNIKSATVLVFILKAALVAMLTGASASSTRGR